MSNATKPQRRTMPPNPARIAANRANARKSTGPRTPEGKAAVAQNAVTHGLLSRFAILKTDPAESVEEFDAFHDGVRRQLQPSGTLEDALVERITFCYWRLARAARFEMLAVEDACRKTETPMAALARSISGDPVEVSRCALPQAPDLDRLVRYESMIDRELHRASNQLKHLRAEKSLPVSDPSGEPASRPPLPPLPRGGSGGGSDTPTPTPPSDTPTPPPPAPTPSEIPNPKSEIASPAFQSAIHHPQSAIPLTPAPNKATAPTPPPTPDHEPPPTPGPKSEIASPAPQSALHNPQSPCPQSLTPNPAGPRSHGHPRSLLPAHFSLQTPPPAVRVKYPSRPDRLPRPAGVYLVGTHETA